MLITLFLTAKVILFFEKNEQKSKKLHSLNIF